MALILLQGRELNNAIGWDTGEDEEPNRDYRGAGASTLADNQQPNRGSYEKPKKPYAKSPGAQAPSRAMTEEENNAGISSIRFKISFHSAIRQTE